MTWEDFLDAGFSIVRSPKADPELRGPTDSKLLEDLRFEIATRLELVGEGEDFATWLAPARPGTCAHCGDKAANYGTCGLCELARAKALRAKHERRRRAA